MNKVIIILAALMLPTASFADEKTGILSELKVTSDDTVKNFWVTLQGDPAMCSLNSRWAYIGIDDINYNAYVSTLLSAHALGSTISLNVQSSGSGSCHIVGINSVKK